MTIVKEPELLRSWCSRTVTHQSCQRTEGSLAGPLPPSPRARWEWAIIAPLIRPFPDDTERQEANRGRQEAVRQAQLVTERTQRAEEMESLAEQRDDQRKAAEAATGVAEKAQQIAEADSTKAAMVATESRAHWMARRFRGRRMY